MYDTAATPWVAISFSSGLQIALAIVPKISGLFSMSGSFFIARDVMKKWRARSASLRITSKIMLNLSIADFCGSFIWHFLSTWMAPKDTPVEDVTYAMGNDATCTAQGFLGLLMLFVSLASNMLMAVAYWLTVCRKWSEAKMGKIGWKLVFLGCPWIYGTCIVVIDLVGEAGYAFDGTWKCSIASGSESQNVSVVMGGVSVLVVIFSMGALVRFAYRIEQRMDQFLSEGQASDRTQTLAVTYQGIWLTAVYFVIVVLIMISSVVPDLPAWYWVLYAFVIPMQGFLNAVVYFRQKYLADREMCNDSEYTGNASWFASLCRVLDVSLPPSIKKSIQRFGQSTEQRQQDRAVQPPQGVIITTKATIVQV